MGSAYAFADCANVKAKKRRKNAFHRERIQHQKKTNMPWCIALCKYVYLFIGMWDVKESIYRTHHQTA